MKIALIGYGKMGRTIEKIATSEGDEVILRIDQDDKHLLEPDQLSRADVAIEFTRPEAAVDNLMACLKAGVPVVSGTTGWLAEMEPVRQNFLEQKGALLYASNFSIGVNLFFALNEHLADLMAGQAAYNISMEEIHHIQKLDAPSGTAITLAEAILERIKAKKSWVKEQSENPSELPIRSIRLDDTPGTHSIEYRSDIDRIEITHEAYSREGFARGALMAARWLKEKQGVFGIRDVLGI